MHAAVRLLHSHGSIRGHGASAGGSFWDHAPELIVVAVGFVAFTGYLWQEQRNEQRRKASLPAAPLDGWQWLTVSLLVISGLAHIPVVPEHLREAPYMGVLFIGYVLAAFALAGAIAARPSGPRYATAVGLCAAAVVAYVATRLIAFPELADDVGAWREPLGMLSVLTEAAVVVIGVVQLWRLTGPRSSTARIAAF
jgi:hypothetical protein